MPFKSKAQRRFMHARYPEMAKEWESKTPKGKKLPEKVKKNMESISIDKLVDILSDDDVTLDEALEILHELNLSRAKEAFSKAKKKAKELGGKLAHKAGMVPTEMTKKEKMGHSIHQKMQTAGGTRSKPSPMDPSEWLGKRGAGERAAYKQAHDAYQDYAKRNAKVFAKQKWAKRGAIGLGAAAAGYGAYKVGKKIKQKLDARREKKEKHMTPEQRKDAARSRTYGRVGALGGAGYMGASLLSQNQHHIIKHVMKHGSTKDKLKMAAGLGGMVAAGAGIGHLIGKASARSASERDKQAKEYHDYKRREREARAERSKK